MVLAPPQEIKVVAQNKTQNKKKSSKKKSTQKPVPMKAFETLGNSGGAMDSAAASISQEVVRSVQSRQLISDEGKSSLGHILNPCGEHAHDSNAKFPDGTLSQSGIQRFRLFETIDPPWANESQVSNVTNNWGLWSISLPAFRSATILVASKDNTQPSDLTWRQLWQQFNTSEVPEWPVWEVMVQNSNFYYTNLTYSSANLNLDDDGESASVESFRLVGCGHVIMHNTPDLWNQGSFAVGQFKADYADTPSDQTLSAATITLNLPSSVSVGTWDMTYKGSVNSGVLVAPVTTSQQGQLGSGITKNFSLLIKDTNTVFANYVGSVIPMTAQFQVPSPGPQGWNFFVTATPSIKVFVPTPTTGTYKITLEVTGQILVSDSPNLSNVTLNLPSLSQKDIVQADPKFSAELMKAHLGFYPVRRYFEPKLLMKNVASIGNIKFAVKGMEPSDINQPYGGIQNDILDLNGTVIVSVIRGISWAAAPTIKACRFVEFLPAPGSSLAPFVGDTPSKDEDAENIFREVQLSGPHSYIPDANSLGLLAAMISSVVEYTPVFLRGARSISQAISKSIDWVEENLFAKVPV